MREIAVALYLLLRPKKMAAGSEEACRRDSVDDSNEPYSASGEARAGAFLEGLFWQTISSNVTFAVDSLFDIYTGQRPRMMLGCLRGLKAST